MPRGPRGAGLRPRWTGLTAATLALVALLGCGPGQNTVSQGTGEGSGESASSGSDTQDSSCGDGVIVTGEYCFREVRLPGLLVSIVGTGDLTGDGVAEIVAQTQDGIRTYSLLADETFEMLEEFGPAELATGSLQVGDFDADGRRDVLRQSAGGWAFYRQLDDGSMELAAEGSDSLLAGGLALAWDTDLDGREEHIGFTVEQTDEGQVPSVVGRKIVDGSWVSVGTGIEFWGSASAAVLSDFDGDGHMEPVVTLDPEVALDPPDSVPEDFDWKSIYLGRVRSDGAGLELGAKIAPGFYPELYGGIDVGDLNGDGHIDIALHGPSKYDYDEPSSLNVIYWGRGDFTFEGPIAIEDVRGGICDLDGDGVAEFYDRPGGEVWRFAGGSFQRESVQPQLAESPISGRIAHLNADHIDDYVMNELPEFDEEPTNENAGLIVFLSNP